MTRRATVVLLLALILAPPTLAAPYEQSVSSENWLAPLRAFGQWLSTTVMGWLSPEVATANLGTHIVPDGLNGQPDPPSTDDSSRRTPREQRPVSP